jgi:hypothetical protein
VQYRVTTEIIIATRALAFNLTVGGFTPVIWFMLSFWCVLVIICMEVMMIRAAVERKK